MLQKVGFVIVLLLVAMGLAACSGAPNRPGDAQPVPIDVPPAEATATPEPPVSADTPTPVPAQPVPTDTPPPNSAETSPAAEGDSNPAADMALTFNISGGIAAFCDNLSITGSGDYTLTSCNQNGPVTGQLDEADRISLQTWRENLADFQVALEDNPDGPDNMARNLVFSGQGQIEVDETQQQVIFDWVNGLIIRLQTPKEDTPPTPTPEPIAGGLCPEIARPALLTIDFENPTILTVVDPAGGAVCNIQLNQPPFGRIDTVSGDIFYPVFQEDTQTVKVWKLDAAGEQTPLDFTGVTLPEPAPYSFILSDNGSKIAWTWTQIDTEAEPPVFRNNLRIANIDGSNQVTILDSVENSEGRFASLVRFSTDSNTLFYALQPDIGGPIFSGRFDTLYSVPAGGGVPQFLYGCPDDQNPVCIGGVAPDGGAITIVQPQEGVIQVLNQEGGLINTLAMPAKDYVERTAFAPNGNMAFLSATLVQAAEGEPPQPNPGYISFVAPPYTEPPQTLLSDNSVGTMRGWLDDSRLIFGALNQDGTMSTAIVDTGGQVTQLPTGTMAVGVLK